MKNVILTNNFNKNDYQGDFLKIELDAKIFELNQKDLLKSINEIFLDFIDKNNIHTSSIIFDFKDKADLVAAILYSVYIRLFRKEITENIAIPIFIISDFSEIEIIKKFDCGSIVLTPNVFVVKSIEDIQKKLDINEKLEISNEYFDNQFKQFFLMPIPEDYENHHSTENILAMKEWKKALKINGKNEDEKDYDLYFQFILSKNLNYKVDIIDLDFLKNYDAKILIIEDQLKEGWRDIFLEIFGEKNEKIKFLGDDFSNKSKVEIFDSVDKEINDFKPNFVITDLRLHTNDFSSNIEKMTGYKLIENIKSKNFGIHVFCMSVTSKAINLKKLNSIELNEFIPKRFSDAIHPIIELIEKFKEYEEIKHISDWVDNINLQRKNTKYFKNSKSNISVIRNFNDLGNNNDDNIIRLKLEEIESFQTYLYFGTRLLSKARKINAQERLNTEINDSYKIYIESSFLNFFIAFEYVYNFLFDNIIKESNGKKYFYNKKSNKFINHYKFDKTKKEYNLIGYYETNDKIKKIDWSNKVLNTFFEIRPGDDLTDINNLINKRNDLIHGEKSNINFKDCRNLFSLISNLDIISKITN